MAITQNAEILKTVRDYIGYIDDSVFNQELLVSLNSIIATSVQLGVVSPNFGEITSDTKWEDVIIPEILNSDTLMYIANLFEHYVCLRTKLLFDPPPSNSKEIFSTMVAELEARITYT